ncbi:MAG: hypothetical protein ACYS5V_17610, partial [Planctomycetota bacterium]
MIFWGGNNLAGYSPYSRGDDAGILSDTARGEAWSARNNADATFMAPDGFFGAENTYLNAKLQNTFDYWYNEMTTGWYPSVHYWFDSMSAKNYLAGRHDSTLEPEVIYMTSDWQEDFMLCIQDHLYRQGWGHADELRDWLGESLINRYTWHGIWNPYQGNTYRRPTHRMHNTTSLKFSPAGDYTMATGTASVDMHLQSYFNSDISLTDWETSYGPTQGIILKTWTDGAAQDGGYVVLLRPERGNVSLWIGASKDIGTLAGPGASTSWEDWFDDSEGHTPFADWVLTTYDIGTTATVNDLGWWNVEATMTDMGGDIQIDVTVTDPGLTQYNRTWTDTGANAVAGAGVVGLSAQPYYDPQATIFDIHGGFDNFAVPGYTVDFESAGDEDDFLALNGSSIRARVPGNGGNVLDLYRTRDGNNRDYDVTKYIEWDAVYDAYIPSA